MKRFFILLLGLVGGFAVGFFSYGKAHVWVNKISSYIEEKKPIFAFEGQKPTDSEEPTVTVTEDAAEIIKETPNGEIVYEETEELDEQVVTAKEESNEEKVVEVSEQIVEGNKEVEEIREVEEITTSVEEEPVKTESVKETIMIDTIHGKNGVAATINGKPITVDEIRFTYDVNPQIKEKLSFQDFYDKAVRVYVEGKILYDAAVASNVLESEEYKKQLALLQQDIARKVFVEKTLEKSVNEETVRKLYEDYRKSFEPQKEIRAKHILVENEALAYEVIAKLNEGQNFDTLAEKYSKEPAELGYFTKDMMIPEFGDAAFSLGIGEYSKKPVKSEYGYHIIFVEDIRGSKPAEYEEAAPQLRQMMTSKVIESLYSGIKKDAEIVVYGFDGKEIPLEEKPKAQ